MIKVMPSDLTDLLTGINTDESLDENTKLEIIAALLSEYDMEFGGMTEDVRYMDGQRVI